MGYLCGLERHFRLGGIEVRKATLASILRKSRRGVRLNEHLEHDCGLTVFQLERTRELAVP